MKRAVMASTKVVGMAVVLCWLAASLAAQFTTASLSGTVVDSSGAGVPDAAVTVLNLDNGFKQTVASGPTGDYLFPRLPVGNYKLTAEKEGFATYVQSGIQLSVNQAATQTVRLNVGAISQQVAV